MRNALAVLLTLALVWMLTACAYGARPMPQATPTPPPPAWLLADCPPLPQPADSAPVSLLQNHSDVTMFYRRCRDRHAALVDWLRVPGR